MEAEKDKIIDEIQSAQKRLKPQTNFNSDYFFQRASIAKKLQIHTDLMRKISLRDFKTSTGGDEQAWMDTPEAKDLLTKMRSQNLEERLCEKQAKRLEVEPNKPIMFPTSPLGLGIKNTGMRKRAQSFRNELIRASHAAHPDPKEESLWCAVTNQYWAPSAIKTVHIFAYEHGQDTMTAIFGAEDPPELFSPRNAILMISSAEERFDKGLFLIVPFVLNDSFAEIQRWHKNEPKEFRIRVCEPKAPAMQFYIPGTKRMWVDLDGNRLAFKSSSRPDARYLYFHYCTMMLRRSWHQSNAFEVLRDELGKLYWGTPGRFMPKSMLLAFVEEMGHGYEQLLEGAMGEDDIKDRRKGSEAETEIVETASVAVGEGVGEDESDEDEDEDEDDDEDDDEDEDEDDDEDDDDDDDDDDREN